MSEHERKIDEICKRCDILQIIDNSFDGIYITDGKANTLLVNKNYEYITGLVASKLLGRNMQELIDENIISASGTLAAIKARKSVTLNQKFISGKEALITSTPIFDDNGEIDMVVTNVRDLTEILKLQNEVEIQNAYLQQRNRELEELKKAHNIMDEFVCMDEKTVSILQLINKVAKTNATVLLTGETGVGKDVFAKYIYEKSARSGKPYIRVNCGALSPTLIESELFGYEKGSFTGASKSGKIGLFQAADGGTLFLDEIGELPLDMQVKLLRVLQEHEIVRVGGSTPIKIDVRIIAATNKKLEDLIVEKKFREDLYYRLSVFPVEIPPLRQRKGDIIPLAKLFLSQLNTKYGFRKVFAESFLTSLEEYEFPGNIRELKNLIERAFIISGDVIVTSHDLLVKKHDEGVASEDAESIDLNKVLHSVEMDYIENAYKKYKNVRDAAKSLGISAATFVRKRKMKEE